MGENAEIFGRLNDIDKSLARIEQTLKLRSDHEERIRKLETKSERMGGWMAGAAAGAAAIVQLLVWAMKHIFGGG